MLSLILQRLSPMLVALAMLANSIGGMLGLGQVIPYNPVRSDVVVSGEVSTDIEKIVETYNAALAKTNQGMVIGESWSEMVGAPVIEAEGKSETTDIALDAFAASYSDNAVKIFDVPGSGIKVSDVKSAKMSSTNGETSIIINIKDFKGDINDVDNGVSRAFGYTSTDIFENGKITVSYTDCVIACVINEKTGKIVYADMDNKGEVKGEDLTYAIGDFVITIDKMEFTLISHIDI